MDDFAAFYVIQWLFSTKGGWATVLSVLGLGGVGYGIYQLVLGAEAGWMFAGAGALFLATGVVIAVDTISSWWRDRNELYDE